MTDAMARRPRAISDSGGTTAFLSSWGDSKKYTTMRIHTAKNVRNSQLGTDPVSPYRLIAATSEGAGKGEQETFVASQGDHMACRATKVRWQSFLGI